MKVYISGPITGHHYNEVESCFNTSEDKLKSLGYETVNPLNNGLPKESTWDEHMKADLKLLLDCDAIYLLDGWEHSKGAIIEFELAKSLGIKILDF